MTMAARPPALFKAHLRDEVARKSIWPSETAGCSSWVLFAPTQKADASPSSSSSGRTAAALLSSRHIGPGLDQAVVEESGSLSSALLCHQAGCWTDHAFDEQIGLANLRKNWSFRSTARTCGGEASGVEVGCSGSAEVFFRDREHPTCSAVRIVIDRTGLGSASWSPRRSGQP